MNQCASCEGFVPGGLEVCPNCKSNKRGWWRLPLTVIGAGIASVTLSACYGPPTTTCRLTLPDGTTRDTTEELCGFDCRNTLEDGGAPASDAKWKAACASSTGDGGVSDAGVSDAGTSDAGDLDAGNNGDH
jgi:hypothetical protein